MSNHATQAAAPALAKSPTGIQGLDEITGGGLPRGRTTLICGGAGSGKTLLGVEFLVRGARDYGESGVFMAFEETAKELDENVRSLGFNLEALEEQQKLVIDHVRVEPAEIAEAGEYDLGALFIRLELAIDAIGAKRVVLDTLETLFGGFQDSGILRAELRRLFHWLKAKGVTAIITAERGDGTFTRQGLEEYVSDCVILLDHRVNDQVATRRLRVVKYRGTVHGTNEYPFLIDEEGIDVLPVTSLGLTHTASLERLPTGIPSLDQMLDGKGFFRGSTILISGTAGTGKSSTAAHFVDAACHRGEHSLYFAFEESPSQILRNMRSIGIDLEPHVKSGLLHFSAQRPTAYGLETHLATMHKLLRAHQPRIVVIDPITNLISSGSDTEVKSMLMRLVDHLKMEKVTSLFTSLNQGGSALESTDVGVSSLIDTWLLVRDIEHNGERNRGLYVLKSRGMAHSNQIREFQLTDRGIQLLPAYLGPEGVLTGSARVAQEARQRAAENQRLSELEEKRSAIARRRKVLEAQLAALRAEFEMEEQAIARLGLEEQQRAGESIRDRQEMARSRRSQATDLRRGNGDALGGTELESMESRGAE
ncbi:MAG TPA: circadian clock protein KaiC [Pirellulaceae bacterium]|nr:circadian clock protein KaiC [Pirellulaceae bacterium]